MGKGFSVKKIKPLSLGIKISDRSGNYIVFCQYCDYWIDSASKYDDAVKVKKAVERIVRSRPLSQYTQQNWQNWMVKNFKKLPTVDAKTWTISSQDLDQEKLALIQNGVHPSSIEGIKETTWLKEHPELK
jgi:hypothetical protein